MSKQVDERIVKMQFDNAEFESRAKNTISTLTSLSSALQFPDGSKGLDQIQRSSQRLDFSALNSAIETVNYRFSLLGSIAFNVFDRIVNKAVDTGSRLVKALTITPATDGFSEYELKMESVKRILNSAKDEDGLPVTLGQVNAKLDELNRYADKTIYSFSDMTSNIGKFTNAGVDLDKAVLAIQGISNEAALSGANAQEASRAMYNFAQALSAGYIKLIDWKSIENANMATVSFKEELIKTALELGTIKKQGDKYVSTTKDMTGKVSEAFDATTLFNESLAHQWMTSEVLTTTLAKYADETTDLGKAAFKAATEVTTFHKLLDTLKESFDSHTDEIYKSMMRDMVALYDTIKPSAKNVGLLVTYQLGKSSLKMRHLTNNEIGQAKSILDVMSVNIMIRRPYDDEYEDGNKRLQCYHTPEGANKATKVEYKLKKENYPMILFVTKNRFGETDTRQIIAECNLGTNICRDVAYTNVPQDW